MPQTWTPAEFQKPAKPMKPDLPQVWSAQDMLQQRTEPIDLRNVTPDNFMRQASARIQQYQTERDARGAQRLTANEQVAIQDAYRQMVGEQPEAFYLTREGAIPKDRFYEMRARRSKASAWHNFQNNIANTFLQGIGGIVATGAKVADTIQISDDAIGKWQKHLNETNRILAPTGGASGALGQIVGTTMFSLLGGVGGAGSGLTWAQRLAKAAPIAGMFGVSAAGQTFGEVAQRRLEGQDIGMLNEWTAAVSNGLIETATEMFGWAAASHLASGLLRNAPGLRRVLAKDGWRGARIWLEKFSKKALGRVLADVPQGYVEEFLAQIGQDATNKVLGITPEIDQSEFLSRAHAAGQMGAAQVLLLGGAFASAQSISNRLGPQRPGEGAVFVDDDGNPIPNVPIGPEAGMPRRQPTTAELPRQNLDFAVKSPGSAVTGPQDSYARGAAVHREGTAMPLGYENIHVRQTSAADNADRVLLVQFASPLVQRAQPARAEVAPAKEVALEAEVVAAQAEVRKEAGLAPVGEESSNADAYHDKLYETRQGYERPDDFWEVPQWIVRAAHAFPNADVYIVRNQDEAVEFANQAGYGQIAFSVLDANKPLVQDFTERYKGRTILGGYADISDIVAEHVEQYDSIEDWAEVEGQETAEGYNYRHFAGTRAMPRLTMSKGCTHKCAFCTVPGTLEETSQETIDQQVDAIVDLDAELVYLDDKTFGQAENHTYLTEVFKRVKERNPDFQGFVVQTTAAQMQKFTPEFLKEAGIRYVELGIESYNDPILKQMKKPANEKLIDDAVAKLREADISLVANFIVGLPGETAETYARSFDFIQRNADVISHLNIYNLALYKGTELADAVTVVSEGDLSEAQVENSLMKDPAVHQAAANEFYEIGRTLLDVPPILQEGVPPDVSMEVARRSDTNKARESEAMLPPDLLESIPDVEDLPDIREPGQDSPYALTDKWAGDRDVADHTAAVLAEKKREALKALVRKGETLAQVNDAMLLYIDMKNNPVDWSNARIAAMPADKQAQIKRVAEMSPEQIEFVERTIQENQVLSQFAKDNEIINNFHENYAARIWKWAGKKGKALQAKFATMTGRQRQRTLGSILAGWEMGLELEVTGVIEAQEVARRQIAQVIIDRNLLELGIKGGLFATTSPGRGWKLVKNPNFQKWTWAGKAEEGKAYGAGVFIDPDGNLFHRVPIYAEKKLATYLNNALGSSAIRELPGVGTLSKYNAIIKQQILFFSAFHHQAYLRSFMLASRGINPRSAYYAGKAAIENFDPELTLLIHEGMTVGREQDYQRSYAEQQTLIGKAIDKVPMVGAVKDTLLRWRDHQLDFLFHKLGPYLKVQAALLDYRARVKANESKLADGRISHREIAHAVAREMNHDFGGLNLRRRGRNPTAQHIFQLLALAPDWTESNIRSMTAAFAKGEMGKVHRAMWGRIALKGVGIIILSNLLLSAWDDETFWSRYQKAWKAGNLKWMDIDVTPIYRGLGGEDGKRKYFNFLGHFRDPAKFTVDPWRAAKGKGSVLTRMALDAITGEDWRGRKFTSIGDLFRKGEVVKWEAFGGGPLEWEQTPSFLLWQAKQATPIQMQSMIDWQLGYIDGWDGWAKSLGFMVSATREKKPTKLRKRGVRRRKQR